MANGNPLQDPNPNYPKGKNIGQKYQSPPKEKSAYQTVRNALLDPFGLTKVLDKFKSTPKSNIDQTEPKTYIKPAPPKNRATPAPKGGVKKSAPKLPAQEQQLMMKKGIKALPKQKADPHPIMQKTEKTYTEKFQNPRHDLIEGDKNL